MTRWRGPHRTAGFYEALPPFLARAQVEDLRHEGELPTLPSW